MGAIYLSGTAMYAAILIGEFLILLNTAPLNAALVNSVSAPIRATAIAVNLFTIHLLGDAFSPLLIGYISDRTDLRMGMVAMIVAVALSGGILALWHEICSAPAEGQARRFGRSELRLDGSEFLQHIL